VNAIAGLSPRVPGLDRRSFSVRLDKMRASPIELSRQMIFSVPVRY
jgi:hypothetical protein